MTTPIIKINNLKKTFPYFKKEPGLIGSFKSFFKRKKLFAKAVDDISFTINKGEFVGFLGPNGAGKTTTLKMLSGILTPTSGEVKILGHTPWQRKSEFQKKFALVMGQKNQLWWDLPAIESFLLFQQIYEIPEKKFRKNLKYLTEMLNITDILNVQVRKLSLGQRMKCELTGALLHDPEILFLDEPTIGLDVSSQVNIRNFLKKYNREHNATIILTSHYMEDIRRLCKRMIMINKGEIVYNGSFKSFTNHYAQDKIIDISFTKHIKEETLKQYGSILKYKDNRAKLCIPNKNIISKTGSILADLPVDNISISDKSLESIIQELF